MTPQEIEARTAAALKGIETLNSVPAPAAAPAIGDKATEPAKNGTPTPTSLQAGSPTPPSAAAPAKDDRTPGDDRRTVPLGGSEDPAGSESPELDARALGDLLIAAKLEAVCADFLSDSRQALARLLRPHATLSKEGVTIGGKPLTRENVLELLGPGMAASLLPSKGHPGSGSRAPGEFRGPNPNAWLGSQEEFEKTKKDIRGRGPK